MIKNVGQSYVESVIVGLKDFVVISLTLISGIIRDFRQLNVTQLKLKQADIVLHVAAFRCYAINNKITSYDDTSYQHERARQWTKASQVSLAIYKYAYKTLSL